MNHLLSKWGFLIAVASFAVNAFAAPTNCPTNGSFATLIATNGAGGCYVENQLFSDFTYLSSATGPGMTPVDDDNFLYTTVEEGPAHIGFEFDFTLSAVATTAAKSAVISLGWMVQGENIISSHLRMTATASGTSVALAQTKYCLGGPVVGCPADSVGLLEVHRGIPGTDLYESRFFSPVEVLGVTTNLSVFALPGSSATITGIRQTIDPPTVPEPASLVLTGGALFGLCFLRRRRP